MSFFSKYILYCFSFERLLLTYAPFQRQKKYLNGNVGISVFLYIFLNNIG